MAARVDGMLRPARVYLAKAHDDLDADPRLITVANKTLALPADGQVAAYGARREDLIRPCQCWGPQILASM